MVNTVASYEPSDQEGCRHPRNMELRLIACRRVEDGGPILRAQDLVHSKERVPDSSKRHFVLSSSDRVDGWNIPPNQLATKDAH
jgi:hypothetical protein